MNNEYERRIDVDELNRLLGCERKLAAIVRWLEGNKPDVFRLGIWDAIHESMKQSED